MIASIAAGAEEKPAVESNDSPKVEVFAPGHGVTAPELVPFVGSIAPPESCDQKLDGKVSLSLLVDPEGRPRYVIFLRPLANDLDRYALRIAEADRFKPGTQNGSPVAVAISLDIEIKSCVGPANENSGNTSPSLWLRALPNQRIGPPPESRSKTILLPSLASQRDSGDNSHLERLIDKVSAPVPLNQVNVDLSDAAKKAKYQGVSIVSVIVDVHGMPQDPRVVRPLGMGLDEKALEAVGRYRFKPAMREGVPVPVTITIEVNFRL